MQLASSLCTQLCDVKYTNTTFPVQMHIYKSRMNDEFPESLNLTILARVYFVHFLAFQLTAFP